MVDGPKLPYEFESKQREYIVVFYLPHINTLIEIKDHHNWHKNEVESGKWAAKSNAALQVVQDGCYDDYMIIYKENWDKCLETIQTRYSLTLHESARSN